LLADLRLRQNDFAGYAQAKVRQGQALGRAAKPTRRWPPTLPPAW